MIYFDSAATSYPKPPAVTEAVVRAIGEFGNASRGAHLFSMNAARCVEETRRQAATLFGCPSPGRVAFTKNATESLNLAIASVDGHIVTTEAEHNSVLRPLYRRGDFSIVPVDERGRYAAADIAAHCRQDTAAVVVAHGSNMTGNLAPVAEIGRLCRERGILLIVDAAQTAGLVAIDMEEMCIDALCFTGHKSLYGLQGCGGICIGERFSPRPLVVGGSGSRTFKETQPGLLPDLLEAGTLNAHGIAALSAGVTHVAGIGPDILCEKANVLAGQFLRGLDGFKRKTITLYGDYEANYRLPIVTLNVRDIDSAEIASELASDYGIAVRAGAHCAPLLHKRFNTERQGALRFSFSPSNTDTEVALALIALSRIDSSRR